MVSECVTGALCGAGHKTSWVTAGGLGSASTADKAHTHPGLPSLGSLGSQTGAWQPQSGVVLSPHSWEGWAGARLSLCLDSHTIVCSTRELMQTSLKGKFSGWGPKAQWRQKKHLWNMYKAEHTVRSVYNSLRHSISEHQTYKGLSRDIQQPVPCYWPKWVTGVFPMA